MISDKTRDGDLPPGVYERDPVTGRLFLTKKMLTSDPPRPIIRELSRSSTDQITNVTSAGVDWMKEEAEKHYELRRQIKGESARIPTVVELRNLAERAAESIMGSF